MNEKAQRGKIRCAFLFTLCICYAIMMSHNKRRFLWGADKKAPFLVVDKKGDGAILKIHKARRRSE